jgi:hypothetical protein
MAIIKFVLKNQTKNLFPSRPVGPVKPGFLSILVCFFLK